MERFHVYDEATGSWQLVDATFEGGEPKQLTNFTSDLIFSYDLSRDGKRLVLSRGTNRSDVVLFSGIKH